LLEHAECPRVTLQRRAQQAVELGEWFLEEDGVINVFSGYPTPSQAEIYGVFRKIVVVFLPYEPLLLSGGNKLAILEEHRSLIVKIARYP